MNAPILPESLFNTSQDSISSLPKKSHSKLHLNPHAPLFTQFSPDPNKAHLQQGSNPANNAPPYGQNYPAPAQNNNQHFNQGPNNGFNGPHQNNFNNFNNGNTYFNAPLFTQTFKPENPPNQHFPPNHSGLQHQNEHVMLPPGLVAHHKANEQDGYKPNQLNNHSNHSNVPPARNRGLHVDTKFHNYVHHVIEEANEEYQPSGPNTPNVVTSNDGEHNYMERQKSKGLNHNNLYAAVLSGRKNDGSMPNSPCPSVTKLKNQYFSGFSTPGSERAQTPTTPNLNPLSEHLEAEDSGNVPMTEDMIENFKLEDHLGHLVEFAKTYNGSR